MSPRAIVAPARSSRVVAMCGASNSHFATTTATRGATTRDDDRDDDDDDDRSI